MGFYNFIKMRAIETGVVCILILIMPYIPPNAEFSKSFSVAPSMPLEGKLKMNERLNGTEIWHKGDFSGPEAFAEYNNEIYTGVHGGDVVKLTGNNHITPIVKFGKPCNGIFEEKKCGRPLGLEFDSNGFLYVADAYYGIFKVDVNTGKKTKLVSLDQEIDGKKPKLPNSIAISSKGDLYWSDSSTEFHIEDGIFDLLADGSGRLIHYDPKTEKNEVLIDKIHFANGVILSEDEDYVLVAETANSRILRYYLKGPKKGTHDIFLDELPGNPDNINSDGFGGYLFPLVTARDASHPLIFQVFSPFPKIRKFVARFLGLAELGFKLMENVYSNTFSQKAIHSIGNFQTVTFFLPKRTTILRVSKDGEILESLHTENGKIKGISEAFIYKNTLFLGSPFNDYIGRISLEKAGLSHLIKNRKTQVPVSKSTTTSSKPPTATTSKPPTTTTSKPITTTTQSPTTTTSKPPTTTDKSPTTTTTTIKPPTTSTTSKPPTTTPTKSSSTSEKQNKMKDEL